MSALDVMVPRPVLDAAAHRRGLAARDAARVAVAVALFTRDRKPENVSVAVAICELAVCLVGELAYARAAGDIVAAYMACAEDRSEASAILSRAGLPPRSSLEAAYVVARIVLDIMTRPSLGQHRGDAIDIDPAALASVRSILRPLIGSPR
jgi:hypothetical protein